MSLAKQSGRREGAALFPLQANTKAAKSGGLQKEQQMWKDHPTIEDFELFLRAEGQIGSSRRNARIVLHIMNGCSGCRQQLRGMGWSESRLERLFRRPLRELAPSEATDLATVQGFDYDTAFEKAEHSLAALLSPETVPARTVESLMTELAELPEDEQDRRLAQPGFAHTTLARHLLENSHTLRYEDPRMMLRLARQAKIAAEASTPSEAGSPERLSDLRARAWGNYGNALRVCGELAPAEEALATAQRYRRAGTGDPPLQGRLLQQWASLRTSQRHFDQAIALDCEAGRIYSDLGEGHQLASTMVQKAIASLYAGETETAIRILNRAIPLIDPEESPQLLLAACHNLVRGYIDLGQTDQALSLYFEARDLYREFSPNTTIRLRARWQEGQLLRDLGSLQDAETALIETRNGFLERGIAYEVAQVSLDLASVYVLAGKVAEVRRTVAETVPIFHALHLGLEAIASLLQLQQAAGQEQQALELIRALNVRLAQTAK
jgi:tetratricopeptide (TPR) repeat protein